MRILLAWLVMLVVAFLNGALRDFTYGKLLPEPRANQISCVSGIVLLGVVIFFYVRHWAPDSAAQALFIGLFWMVLTIAFEFLFFHYVGKRSWAELWANYDLARGRLWPLILLWVLLAPYWFYRMLR